MLQLLFLPLYLLLSPSRYYLFCINRPPPGWGKIWVVLLHHYIHAYKLMFLQHIKILMAKEVNKEVKKAVAASVPNHEIL
jgi:hypothetical protein